MYRFGHQAKHRLSKTPEYKAYHDMKQRCYLITNKNYATYGGRGITVCDRWMEKPNGFKNFLEDLGYRPSRDHSLDRVDGDKGYSKENCRWASSGRQTSNRGVTLRDTNGETLSDIVKRTGIKYDTIYHRYLAGLRGADLSHPVMEAEPRPSESPIPPNLGRAINELMDYAHDLDSTELPAQGEYDATADIRLVCQALIDALSPPPSPAPVPSPDGASEPFKTCPGCEMRRTCADMKHCYGPSHAELKERFALPPSPAGAIEIANEIDAALNKFLNALSDPEIVIAAKADLREALWNNKAGIVAYLRRASPPVRGDREAIARAIFKNRQHLSDEDVAKWFKIYADNPEGIDHFRMAIWRAYSDADAILSVSVQPGAGEREALIALVEKSMRDTWNDYCSDTGCHPDDIEHGRGKILFFEPKCWARFTGEAVADALSRQAPHSSSEESK